MASVTTPGISLPFTDISPGKLRVIIGKQLSIPTTWLACSEFPFSLARTQVPRLFSSPIDSQSVFYLALIGHRWKGAYDGYVCDHRYIESIVGGFGAISLLVHPILSRSFLSLLSKCTRLCSRVCACIFFFFFYSSRCLPKLDIHGTFPRVVLCNSQWPLFRPFVPVVFHCPYLLSLFLPDAAAAPPHFHAFDLTAYVLLRSRERTIKNKQRERKGRERVVPRKTNYTPRTLFLPLIDDFLRVPSDFTPVPPLQWLRPRPCSVSPAHHGYYRSRTIIFAVLTKLLRNKFPPGWATARILCYHRGGLI